MTTNQPKKPARNNNDEVNPMFTTIQRKHQLSDTLNNVLDYVGDPPPNTQLTRNISFLILHNRVEVVTQIGLYKVLGCAYPNPISYYGLDLSPFGAYRLGVSRLHAVVSVLENEILLIDNESRNGTLLNGILLDSHQPYILENEDHIDLAGLTLQVLFKD